MDGWVKIHRKIKDNWIWQKPEYLMAWLDLIFRANYEESKILFDGEFKELKRGQFVTSIRKLSDAWGWSKDRTLKFLRLLEADNMIKKDSDTRRTLITIENYELYQVSQDTNKDTDKDTNKDTNSPQKRKKEKKNNNTSENDSAAEKTLDEKLEHNFAVIYKEYPKKVGRAEAYRRYVAWVTTGRVVNKKRIKLTDMQILKAVKKYVSGLESRNTAMEFYKDFSTFMGNSILDYVDWSDKE